MAQVTLRKLFKRYGPLPVVHGIDLVIPDGKFVALVGPSGCGKTTTLRMIAGLVEPSGGAVRLGGTDITWLPPWRRNTGMVFQS